MYSKLFLAGLTLCLSAAAISGCSAAPPGSDSPGEDLPDAGAASGHGVGECFIGSFEFVDCASPHEAEIVSTFTGFDINTEEGLVAADAQCGIDTIAFLGASSLPDAYRYGIYGDGGTTLCYAGLKDGSPTTGSLQGVGG